MASGGREKRRTKSPKEARQELEARSAARRSRQLTANYAEPGDADDDPRSVSATYFILRWGMFVLAGSFPFALMLGGYWSSWYYGSTDWVQGSLNAYYHFSAARPETFGSGTMRDVFVGVLCAVGAFLVLYRGYHWLENLALDVAGVCAVAIALFPMDWPACPDAAAASACNGAVARTTIAKVHVGSAVVFSPRSLMSAFSAAMTP